MIKGQHTMVTQWIEGRSIVGSFVVRVEVEAVIPDTDPSEPCFEPPTLRFLDEVQRLADAGEIDALARVGQIYIRRSA